MKSIGVLTDGKNLSVQETINEDLRYVFGDSFIINYYHINQLNDNEKIDDDAILILENERLEVIGRYVENKENIIIVERTFKKKNITELFDIPKNSKVLVVNSTRQTTLETVSHLYQIIESYLNLIPYKEGEVYEDVKFAITPGEIKYVPACIKKIIDIKNRNISIYTFINILNKLNIEDKQIIDNIMNYSEEIVDINSSVIKQYKELYLKNALLGSLTERLNEGILIINKNYKILFINDKARELLGTQGNVKDIRDIIDDNNKEIYLQTTFDDKLVKLNNRNILISKTKMNYYIYQEDYVLSLKEDLYIKNLGNSLNNQMKKRGFIAKYTFSNILHISDEIDSIIDFAKKIASTDHNILIIGDTGTGKEMFAQAIHNQSNRKDGPFIAINCAVLPENLLESELFGYEKGAFTGANKDGKIGLFELANSGTLLLDEIGDMPYLLQTRLLRVIQEKQIMRLGSDKLIDIDVRFIAATNKDVKSLIKDNKFREDLFYRLNTFQLNIPKLMDRKEDILYLLDFFTDSKSDKLNDDLKQMLLDHPWDGNVRELINVANYINLMGSNVPSYIKRNELNDDGFHINSLSIYQTYTLLKIIDEHNKRGESVGREKLLNKMSINNTRIGEHKLKNAIKEFQELGLIEVRRGRVGTIITTVGRNFIESLKKDIINCVK